jgi:hypothetical protein
MSTCMTYIYINGVMIKIIKIKNMEKLDKKHRDASLLSNFKSVGLIILLQTIEYIEYLEQNAVKIEIKDANFHYGKWSYNYPSIIKIKYGNQYVITKHMYQKVVFPKYITSKEVYGCFSLVVADSTVYMETFLECNFLDQGACSIWLMMWVKKDEESFKKYLIEKEAFSGDEKDSGNSLLVFSSTQANPEKSFIEIDRLLNLRSNFYKN